MNIDIFLMLLMIVSILTGLITEAVKMIFDEINHDYHANILAGVVAVLLSIGLDVTYMVMAETAFNDKMAVILIALVLLSWLSAMIGYDKVVQAIAQIMGSSSKAS